MIINNSNSGSGSWSSDLVSYDDEDNDKLLVISIAGSAVIVILYGIRCCFKKREY